MCRSDFEKEGNLTWLQWEAVGESVLRMVAQLPVGPWQNCESYVVTTEKLHSSIQSFLLLSFRTVVLTCLGNYIAGNIKMKFKGEEEIQPCYLLKNFL